MNLKSALLIRADCVSGMASLRARGAIVKLVCADPPYNFGQKYADYNDKKSLDEYGHFTHEWITAAYSLLDSDGSMFVFCPDEWVSETDMLCRNLGMTRRNWIIWQYTFGQACQRSFTRSHTHILYFTKSKTQFTFNDQAVRVPSARQAVYKDKRARAGGKLPDDTWAILKADLEQAANQPGDVWLANRVCGTYKERRKHSPNQLPTLLTDRIVRVASNPGDTVVCPFLGTGAEMESCVLLGRRFIGFDVSQECVEQSARRFQEVTNPLPF
jgi:DNA modification methylase